MLDDKKTKLEGRIKECQQKIEELNLFRDDIKIANIIAAFRKQIAQDFCQLELLGQDVLYPTAQQAANGKAQWR